MRTHLPISTIPVKRWDLREWLAILAGKLKSARGIVLDLERLQGIAAILFDSEFTQEQAKECESWILAGDWTYKKNNTLELSDFYKKMEMKTKTKTAQELFDEVKHEMYASEGMSFFGNLEKEQLFEYRGSNFRKVGNTTMLHDQTRTVFQIQPHEEVRPSCL